MDLQQPRLMEHYGHGERMVKDHQDKILHLIVMFHHQFKYLVLHGILFLLLIVVVLQLKLMEHCGHGEIMELVVNQDLVILHIDHHQFRQVLVLIGVNHLIIIIMQVQHLKLMEHYGYGDLVLMEHQHKIMLIQIIIHQFKYLVLSGLI